MSKRSWDRLSEADRKVVTEAAAEATALQRNLSAERASRSNDAQIITMGARVIVPELAKRIVDTWLASTFDGGGSQPKVDRIREYEREGR